MLVSRRQIMAGTTAITLFPSVVLAARASSRSFFGPRVGITGTLPTNPDDEKLVPRVLKEIPTTGHVAAMKALANLHTNPNVPQGSTRELWNRRWRRYANPLLVHIWQEMGYSTHDDCDFWCGVTLGWCLKRSGMAYPPDCARSQAYLTDRHFRQTTAPRLGDLCVFTNINDKNHGHVTIFERALPSQKAVFVVGANQSLSIPTNCPGNLGVNVVDERAMALKTRGHVLNKYMRPV